MCVAVVADQYSLYLSPSTKVFENHETLSLPEITYEGNGIYLIKTGEGRKFDDFGYMVSQDGEYTHSLAFSLEPVSGTICQNAVLKITEPVSARVLRSLVVTVLAKKKPSQNQA